MTLTREQNEQLTRVGPGTPMGDLLRRYWHPVAVARELTDEQPTKFVRILGEDLVLFKDKSGNAGLIQDHCPHRGASLLYGRVEDRGIACAYHGWLFDTSGNCLETPAEPAGSMFHLTVKARAYPVQQFLGLYWAYLGPLPAPVIPPYDHFVAPGGYRTLDVYPRLDCNWLQAMENSVDPAHLQVLHQTSITSPRKPENTTRGFTDEVAGFEFYEVPCGIIKKRTYKDGRVDEHPLVFPNILRQGNSAQIRVPIDDEHTRVFFVHYIHGEPPEGYTPNDPPVHYVEPFKHPVDARHPFTRMSMDLVLAQDHMAWETQGPIADRTVERLATSDRGVVLLREVLFRELEKVQRGEDPKGVIRDPEHEIIDTHLGETIETSRNYPRTYSPTAAELAEFNRPGAALGA
jgi:5,5'-dehydrodivanillate O-demethylase oxygenase subunit